MSEIMENKIKRIIVPMDGSKTSFRALAEAIEVARACHATILGIHSIPFLPADFRRPAPIHQCLGVT